MRLHIPIYTRLLVIILIRYRLLYMYNIIYHIYIYIYMLSLHVHNNTIPDRYGARADCDIVVPRRAYRYNFKVHDDGAYQFIFSRRFSDTAAQREGA